MIFPSLRFVYRDSGEDLPSDGEIQRTVQYGGEWAVRLDGTWPGKVFLQADSPIELAYSDGLWVAPPKGMPSGAGYITAILRDAQGREVPGSPSAHLYVEAASLSPAEVQTVLDDIGALALQSLSHLSLDVHVAKGEGAGLPAWGYRWRSAMGLSYAATALLELWQEVRRSWRALERRPLKDFRNEVAPVRGRSMQRSGKALVQSLVDPPNKLSMAITRLESNDCSENRFLCYVLDVALGQAARALARSLRVSLGEPMPQFVEMPGLRTAPHVHALNERAMTVARQLEVEFGTQRSVLEAKASELEECIRWAQSARSALFLREVPTPATAPTPTQRLLGNPAYQGILQRFNACRGAILKRLESVLALLESIERGQVRATWELYEIWCVVQVYAGLIRHVNLVPPAGKPTLFDDLHAHQGMLKLKKNTCFELEGSIDTNGLPPWRQQEGGARAVHVDFWYEREMVGPEGQRKTPDLVLKVTLEKGWQTETKTFCFDSKYRDYRKQTSRQLLEDICDTARTKYQDRFGFDASFILHNDSAVDYWGELPLAELSALSGSDQALDSAFPQHRYGAISFRPGRKAPEQAYKLISMLFRYHANLTSVCLSCGQTLRFGQDIRASWVPPSHYKIDEMDLIKRILTGHEGTGNGAGVYCSCPRCGRWWVVQHCFDQHDLIIKSHEYHLHRPSRHPEFRGKLMYACPTCGSDPSMEEIRQRRAALGGRYGFWSLEGL